MFWKMCEEIIKEKNCKRQYRYGSRKNKNNSSFVN